MSASVCHHCRGTGSVYVITSGAASLNQVTCTVCNGSGAVVNDPPSGGDGDSGGGGGGSGGSAVTEPELWPILVPLGIFTLFFVFLAL